MPSLDQLVTLLRSVSVEQAADILAALDRGMELWAERKGVRADSAPAPAPAKKSVGRPRKAAAAPAAAPLPLPAAAGGAPSADAYRLSADAIVTDKCVARTMNETDASKDKRWSPAVYREFQCGGSLVEGSDLCVTCQKRFEAFTETGKPKNWNGRVTEEPPAWSHMLGTAWAAKCKWNPDGTASGAASVASAADLKAEAAVEKKATAKAEKEAAKAKKEAEKAEKEAAKKAAAEKKAADAAAKKSAAAEKKDAKPKKEKAEKPKKEVAKKGGAAAPAEEAAPAKADTAAVVAEAAELTLIDGSWYSVKNGNVYEYDNLTEETGDFVGRLTAEGTIDADAEEADESDEE